MSIGFQCIACPYPVRELTHLSPMPDGVAVTVCLLQGGAFYGLEQYPWHSAPMYLLVGLAKLVAIAVTVQAGFRVSAKHRFLTPAGRGELNVVLVACSSTSIGWTSNQHHRYPCLPYRHGSLMTQVSRA